ncbi:hypothetical protein DERP_010462 [Dermatophagoides pteronyssinus]|uniref:Uncharacterized protein n=1 Tax=Dermatophagoides pteronyssinus TaxID=6956 RepID=A0ABQ8J559_DERPT|nr:hypothetical protein DERP_010462 [Dermatophagoides pteronyssinus]
MYCVKNLLDIMTIIIVHRIFLFLGVTSQENIYHFLCNTHRFLFVWIQNSYELLSFCTMIPWEFVERISTNS